MSPILLVSIALLALAGRALHAKRKLAAWERLWRFTAGPVTVELRRHAGMSRFDRDSLEFPQPREFRILSMRIGGIPVWSQQAIVTLPSDADARLSEIPAAEFDPLFAGQFRLTWSKPAVRALYAARHGH